MSGLSDANKAVQQAMMEQQIKDLSTLVKMLSYRLNKLDQNNSLSEKAINYLERHQLMGNPLIKTTKAPKGLD